MYIVSTAHLNTTDYKINTQTLGNKENIVFKDGIGVQGLRSKVVKFDSLGLGTCEEWLVGTLCT